MPFDTRRDRRDELRVNRRIRVPEVRLIGEEGEQLGVFATYEAIRKAEDAGLDLVTVETFRQGYADTLAEWRRRFAAAAAEVDALGFDAQFRRLWVYYLCYCEAGFRTGTIDVGLYVLKG